MISAIQKAKHNMVANVSDNNAQESFKSASLCGNINWKRGVGIQKNQIEIYFHIHIAKYPFHFGNKLVIPIAENTDKF